MITLVPINENLFVSLLKVLAALLNLVILYLLDPGDVNKKFKLSVYLFLLANEIPRKYHIECPRNKSIKRERDARYYYINAGFKLILEHE